MNNDQRYNNQSEEAHLEQNQNKLFQQSNPQQKFNPNPNRKNYTKHSVFENFHPCTKIGLILVIIFSILVIIAIPILFICISSLFFVGHHFINDFQLSSNSFIPTWILLVILIIFSLIFLIIHIIALVWSIKITKGKKPLGVGFIIYSFFCSFIIGWILLLIGWSLDRQNKTNSTNMYI